MRYKDVVWLAVGFAFMYVALHGVHAVFAEGPFVRGVVFESEMVACITAGSIALLLGGAALFAVALYSMGSFLFKWACYIALLVLYEIVGVFEKGLQAIPARSE